ncbi:PWI domain protein [Necator americanus]|uniref:PWI domain protein n=1 Tax=Necator americanus TaxID=51031 RepID=W2SW78_NECAM|nr:PWI domain protein [Necator americanus]ETN74014.1 PWI domain protein [Necator americanus]
MKRSVCFDSRSVMQSEKGAGGDHGQTHVRVQEMKEDHPAAASRLSTSVDVVPHHIQDLQKVAAQVKLRIPAVDRDQESEHLQRRGEKENDQLAGNAIFNGFPSIIGISSEDSEEARERRNLKKQIKEKEQAYVARLTKWEARERQKAKQYEREERREKDRRRDILKEAKKLKHFLEDYDDEKDDPKYYNFSRSSSLFQRKRDFEREREADSKDRLREQQEIEELRKQILAENKDIQDVDEEARRRHLEKEEAAMRRLREDSGSPNPHQPLGQRDGDGDSSSSSEESDDEEDGKSLDGKSIGDDDQDAKTPKSDAPAPTTSQEDRWKSGVDDEDEEGGRKHLRPFEITQEERMETLTTDEKKRMVKDLINNIPTTKGEEESALVDFVCEKVATKTSPDRILSDIAMILDEDAEVFVVKMWRLLIYESEAKKLGLVVPRSSQ